MNYIDNIRYDFEKEWNSVGVYHAKSLFKDLPDWEEILNILNRAIRDKDSKIILESKNDFEIIHKDLFAIKKLAYLDKNSNRHTIESDATFFFSLFFNEQTFGSVISESIKNQSIELDKLLDIKSDFTSLKISLSDKFVPYEVHEWHTCIMHLAGTNEWKLRNKSVGLERLYFLEPGDILLFKKGIEHELSNEKPRSSIVGRFELGDSHE
jgi:hypothetical protein